MQAPNEFWNTNLAPLNTMQPIGDDLHVKEQYNRDSIERYIDLDLYERDRFNVLRPDNYTSTTGARVESAAKLVDNNFAGTSGGYTTPRSFLVQPALSVERGNIPNEKKYQAKKLDSRNQLAEGRSTIQAIRGIVPAKKENKTSDLDYWALKCIIETFNRDLDQNSIVASISINHPAAAVHLAAFLQKVKDSVAGSSRNRAPITPYTDLEASLDVALTAMQALPGLATPIANIGLRGLDWRLSVLSYLLDSAALSPLYESGAYNGCLRILEELVGNRQA